MGQSVQSPPGRSCRRGHNRPCMRAFSVTGSDTLAFRPAPALMPMITVVVSQQLTELASFAVLVGCCVCAWYNARPPLGSLVMFPSWIVAWDPWGRPPSVLPLWGRRLACRVVLTDRGLRAVGQPAVARGRPLWLKPERGWWATACARPLAGEVRPVAPPLALGRKK